MIKYLHILNEGPHRRKCAECGKTMSFFEGYRHPTLGSHHLLCKDCFDIVEESVERWGRAVLWNSFNPNGPDPTYIDNYPFPHDKSTLQHKKTKHH